MMRRMHIEPTENERGASPAARRARVAVENTERNKAGHREKALELVDQAIAEVEAGMRDAR